MLQVNPFAGKVRNAAVFENGKYLTPPGKYRCSIERCLVKQSRAGKQLFIVEMNVLQSNQAEDPIGTKRSWCQDMGADSAFSEIKKFVYAVLALDFTKDKEKIKNEIDPKIEELLGAAVDPDTQELKGREVNVETANKKTRANKDFTQHLFTPAA